MWKAERFEGAEDKDPLEELLDFVNAHHLQPGQFQFAVASDDEGYQFCVMLYTEEKVAAQALPAAPPRRAGRPGPEGERPSRFAPGGPPRGEGGGRRSFQPGGGAPPRGKGAAGGRPYGGGGGRSRGGGGGSSSYGRGGGGGRPKGRGGPKR